MSQKMIGIDLKIGYNNIKMISGIKRHLPSESAKCPKIKKGH